MLRIQIGILLLTQVANGQHVIWSQAGDGVVSRTGLAAATGDQDGDGWSEYVQVGWVNFPANGQLWLYSGRDGTRLRQFDHPWGFFSYVYPSLDVDGDGLTDFAVVGGTNQLAALELRSAKDGHVFWALHHAVGPAATWGNFVVADIDVDGDGNPDVITGGAAYMAGAVQGGYYVYDHRGQFRYARLNQNPSELWPQVARLGDVDGDCGEDFAVLVWVGPSSFVDVVSGRTGTTLVRHPSPSASHIRTLSGTGDLDGDGVCDLILAGDRVEAFNPVTGQVIHSWGLGIATAANHWWYVDGTRDLDRDGITDVMATISIPGYLFRLSAWSGRDGTELWRSDPSLNAARGLTHLPTTGGLQRSLLAEVAPLGVLGTGRVALFGWEPAVMTEVAPSCQGTLPDPARMGMRTIPGGFRVTLSGAPAGSVAVLVVGTQLQSVGLSPFGFPLCELHPDVVDFGVMVTGVAGLERGYAKHDWGVPLSTPTALGMRVYGQWLVLDGGPSLAGGTSETLSWFMF